MTEPPTNDEAATDRGASSVLALDDGKAGMTGLNKAEIERIINDTSRGSPFFQNEERKAQSRKEKIDAMLEKSREFDSLDHFPFQRRVDALVKEAETHREIGCFIHLDMDAFFCAVEERLNPSLKEIPFGVGSIGMLSTSNYVARKFGVRAAMPGYIAKKLCPQLVIIPCHFELYGEASERVRTIVGRYDPDFSSGGMDELTMNASPYCERHNSENEVKITAWQLAQKIREEILAETNLTASCGIAPTPVLAKIVANYNKPNGQYELQAHTPQGIFDFVATLPVRKMPGVGKVTEGFLTALGIETFGDFYDQRYKLSHVFTPKTFEFLLRASLGVAAAFAGFGHVGEESEGRKSRSFERTFAKLQSETELEDLAKRLTDKVAKELQEEELFGSQLVLKLKYHSFQTKQATLNIERATNDAEEIWKGVSQLLRPFIANFDQFRLLGVKVTSLTQESGIAGKAASKAKHSNTGMQTLSQLLQRKRERETIELLDEDEEQACDVEGVEAAPRVAHGDDDDVIVLSDDSTSNGSVAVSCGRSVDVIELSGSQ